MAIANLTIRFIVELAGIAAFGYWGLQVAGPALAAVAVAIAVVAWGVVVAPKARNRLPQEQRDIVGSAILLLASVSLVAVGQILVGVGLAVVVILNAIVLRAIGPGVRDGFATSAGQGR